MKALVNGKEIKSGDVIKDFRGDEHVFKMVSRLPDECRSGKVVTDQGEFYHTVFPGLTVVKG